MFSPKVVVGSSISVALSTLVPFDGQSTEVVDVMWLTIVDRLTIVG
jgi:hypothetical protein